MIDTRIIDGKAIAAALRADIAQRVERLKQQKRVTPGLAVVLVGNNPASEVYVRNKAKQTREAGMFSLECTLPETISEVDLLAKVHELNADPAIHGILVQLPLPGHINPSAIINAVDPLKDVDGFHVINAGKLATGQDCLMPCTPLGCRMLLQETLSGALEGKHAVIVGRSNIVGKPMAALLLQDDCTVTVAHSKTQELPQLVKTADILIAATGRPEMVKGDWIKPGAVVIDVGINRITLPDNQTKLVGDVAFEECLSIASAITPVPGGVGPMTIACLLENTYRAAVSISS